jgi:hypothetical protein
VLDRTAQNPFGADVGRFPSMRGLTGCHRLGHADTGLSQSKIALAVLLGGNVALLAKCSYVPVVNGIPR